MLKISRLPTGHLLHIQKSWTGKMVDIHRRAANWRSNTLTLQCLACHITTTSQLLCKVNKFLLVYLH